MKMLFVPVAVLLLGGCAIERILTPEPIIITKEVRVPIATSCVPDSLDPEPSYAVTKDTLKETPSVEQRYQNLFAGFMERELRLTQIEPVIRACRKAD